MNESANSWYRGCAKPWRNVLAITLGVLLSLQTLAAAAQSPNQHPAGQQGQSTAANAEIASGEHSADALPSAPEPQSAPQQQQPAQQQGSPQQPVGTAAAPYEKPTGVPGSRPAGAAIAPAKQKRVRSIVIRVGLLVAGGAAIGAVVGLSRASHSQP